MLRCRVLTLIAVGIFVPAGLKAQSSVTLKATVSETVALSVSPTSIPSNIVSLTLSGDDQIVRVPLLVRSNSGFKISAILESKTAVLTQLSVDNVRAMGSLVSPQVVNTLDLKSYVDPDISQPLLVASGPRISIGGTLHSPDNALEITLLIRWKPELSREPVHLTLAATPVSLIQ